MLKTIVHPILKCPYCDSRKVRCLRTISIKSKESNNILRTERYFKCSGCSENFKTMDYLS
jgi:transcriptional regulator NrdR family protein